MAKHYPIRVRNEVFSLARDGYSTDAMAARTGVARKTIQGWLRDAGVKAAPPNRNWYTPGPVGGGIEVIAVMSLTQDLSMLFDDRSYLVRYLCCSRTVEMSQEDINRRIHRGQYYCKSCSAIAGGKKKPNRQIPIPTGLTLTDAQLLAMSGRWSESSGPYLWGR